MRAAIGVILFVGAIYALTGPGRIDIIDGQYRFEVAKNILETRSIQIMDPALAYALPGIAGAYSPYGISASIVALPLLVLARTAGHASIDRLQFFFSLSSAAFGAATAGVVFLFYRRLGITSRPALLWTLVAAFATLAFPAATSTFDQTQHGFFIISAIFLAFASARRQSMFLAVASGVCLAVLVNFQETYVVLLPAIGLAALAAPGSASEERRRSIERLVVIAFVGGLGLLFWAGLNNFRFGTLLVPRAGVNHPSPIGNPLIGLPGLLISPGKSLFLYSPATAIALAGFPSLWRRERQLGLAVGATSLVYLGMISSLSFYGGDWCWGPRYFASILPLVALGFPFVRLVTRRTRLSAGTIIAVSLAVQCLAISVDHHRFFYARSLQPFFWYENGGFYYRHSALFARPGELWETIHRGVPLQAESFRPGPYPDQLTYAIFGGWGHRRLTPPAWMEHYRVFWLPRPWPFWMRTVPAEERPINISVAEMLLGAMIVTGGVAFRGVVRESGKGPQA